MTRRVLRVRVVRARVVRARVAVRHLALVSLCAGVALISACIHTFWRTDARAVRPASANDAPYELRTPVKVHLLDGSTLVFPSGVRVSATGLSGGARRFLLLQDESTPVLSVDVPMDSVVGVEAFEAKLLAASTVTVSVAATAVGAVGTVALLKALFGSYPTLYSDSSSGSLLQAEGFSYAIAPRLEHRDLDPLSVRAGPDGVVRLELRNEALETHRLNHLELTAVRHGAHEIVVPDQRGRVVSVDRPFAIRRAVDRRGRDVRALLDAADGRLFATDSTTLLMARESDLDDWIDLDVDGLPAGDSLVLVLRLRNSLLNTVLLYDGMLGGRDATDWMSETLQTLPAAIALSRWYTRTMGMHLSVDGAPAPVPVDGRASHARLSDVGPLAFRDVAVVLPRSHADAASARIRLRFVADNWRIDQVRVAGAFRRPVTTRVALSRVMVPVPDDGGAARPDTAAVGALAAADSRYYETRPGQRVLLEFAHADATPSPGAQADSVTRYLISWQGWYREWVRGAWLASPSRVSAFVPNDAAVATALAQWRTRKTAYEQAFYATRIPVK